MEELGITTDLTIETSRSLSEFKTLTELKAAHAHSQWVKAEKEEIRRKNRNHTAKLRRAALKAEKEEESKQWNECIPTKQGNSKKPKEN